MTSPNPHQPTATPAAKPKCKLTIPRDANLASYCFFVAVTMTIVGLLLVWPVIFNLMMATDSIASMVRFSPPSVHYLLSLLFAIASAALFTGAVLTLKISKYIPLAAHPDFVYRVAQFQIIYFPLGTILYFWLRSIAKFEKPLEE